MIISLGAFYSQWRENLESFCVDSREAKCIGTDSLSVTKDANLICS